MADDDHLVVCMLALNPKTRIKYRKGKKTPPEKTGLFMFDMYALPFFDGHNLLQRLITFIEKSLREKPALLHCAIETPGLEDIVSELGYKELGDECMCCPGYELGKCKGNIPLFVKKIK